MLILIPDITLEILKQILTLPHCPRPSASGHYALRARRICLSCFPSARQDTLNNGWSVLCRYFWNKQCRHMLLQILNITTNALPIILLNTVSVFFIIIPLKIPIFSQITKSNACWKRKNRESYWSYLNLCIHRRYRITNRKLC